MQDLLRANLEFLEQNYPDLVFDPVHSNGSGFCEIFPARLTGKPTLKVSLSGRELSVHSSYDPEEEARRWARSLDLRGIRYLGVFGLGLGYHVRELNREWPGLEKIVVIEPSQAVFRAALNAVPLHQVLEPDKVTLLILPAGEKEDGVADPAGLERDLEQCLAALFRIGQLDALQFAEFGPYRRLFPEFYEVIRKACVNLGRAVRIYENTTLFFSQMWPRNIFANLVDTVVSPGVASLFGKFEGRPGIVISAGPSLNKNKHLLKEARGKAVLICVGTALRALLKDGIAPDLVITLDGAEANYRHFAGLEWDDVPLVFVPTAHYQILEEHHGRKFVVGGGNSLIDWVCKFTEPKGVLAFGGSVAHAAFDLALRMGCEPVVLVGQDLAFTGGETHARGTLYENNRVEHDSSKFYVEDVFGGQVLTDHVLSEFRRWFERALSGFARGRLVIDATEGGARIAGTVIMPLREVLDRYCRNSFPVTEIISAAAGTGRTPEAGRRLLAALEEAVAALEALEKTARKGARLARSLGLEYRKSCPERRVVQKLLKRMDKIDLELRTAEADTFLNLILQPVLLAVEKGCLAKGDAEEGEREFAQRVAARSLLLYEGIKEAAEKMREYMERAQDDLRDRLDCPSTCC